MGWSTEDVSCTLHNGACAGFQNAVVTCKPVGAFGFDMYNQQSTGGVSRTVKTPVGGDDLPVVCIREALPFDTTQVTSPMNYSSPKWGDPCHPLAAKAHPPSVICKCYDARGNGDGSTVSTITGDHNNRVTDYTSLVCYGIGNGQANQSYSEEVVGALNCMHDQQAVCYGVDCRNFTEQPELYPTLQAKPNGGQSLNYSGAVRTQYIVRRLTPTECSRLQGFPDFWGHPDTKTEFTDEEYEFWLNVRNTHAEINGKTVKPYTKDQMLNWYNKLHTDSSEYKLWGNGIALPTALYMMQGIAEVFA